MNSSIGKLYPSTKFALMLLLVIFSIFTPGYVMQYLMFPLVVLISLCAGTGKQFLGTFFKSIFIIILFIFAIQVFIISLFQDHLLIGKLKQMIRLMILIIS